MRRLAMIAALVLLLAPTAQAQPLKPAVFISVRDSVVRVEAEGKRGELSLGSGVTVAPAIVVTNCHVIRNANTIRIAGHGNLWGVTGQYSDVNHDLCFLRAPNWPGKPVVVADRDALHFGEAVAAVGFTGGVSMSFRLGQVRGLHALDGGRVIESDSAFTSGASGGGLFDSSGALVGLLTFRSRSDLRSYYSLPVRWIRDSMPSDDQWAAVHPLDDGVPFWQRDSELQPYFMQAAQLQSQRRWTELIGLAEQWSSACPGDVEPLRVRGDALQRLDRREDAVQAFSDAVRLAPDDGSAWYGLAIAYASIGNRGESLRAQSVLAGFDRDLAARLHDAIEELGVTP